MTPYGSMRFWMLSDKRDVILPIIKDVHNLDSHIQLLQAYAMRGHTQANGMI